MKTIPASDLDERHYGRLVSHPGAPTPLRLWGSYPLRDMVFLQWRGEFGGHTYPFETAVTADTEITIHDEP